MLSSGRNPGGHAVRNAIDRQSEQIVPLERKWLWRFCISWVGLLI